LKNRFYLTVLKFLYNKGLHNLSDVSSIVSKHFKNQKNAHDTAFADVKKNIDIVFENLIKNEHITNFRNGTKEGVMFDSNGNYLKAIKVQAEITTKGIDYYKSTKFNWIVFCTIVATIAAVLTLLFSYFKVDVNSLKMPLLLKKEAPAIHQKQKTIKEAPKTSASAHDRKLPPS
jgi:hypothetical protein